MKTIISPGRIKYIREEKQAAGCVLCTESARDADLVLYEGTTCYAIMNKYPYTSGHIMIVPYRHLGEFAGLSQDEKLELMDLADKAVEALQKAFTPEGFNIGMNLGKAAGAGLDQHLHLHVVPRWAGDTNYITVLGDARIIPEEIEKTRDILLKYF